LTLPLRIHDLSAGGCLIESHHEEAIARRLTMEIELPDEGWMTLNAEVIYVRSDYGFAVKFIEMSDDTRTRLDTVIQRLRAQANNSP
jgi:PilZ domain-containing protein